MVNESVTKGDVLAYLAALTPSYPGGVPLRFVKDSAETEAQCKEEPRPSVHASAALIFAAGAGGAHAFAGAEGELLKAAIEKGLQRSTDSVEVASCTLSELFERSGVMQGRRIVALGARLWSDFPGAQGMSPGDWIDHAGARILLTHSLAEVLASRATKKNFWLHLQSLLAEKE